MSKDCRLISFTVAGIVLYMQGLNQTTPDQLFFNQPVQKEMFSMLELNRDIENMNIYISAIQE